MADPVQDGLFHEYQSLGVSPSTRRTYRVGVRSYQQFCNQFNIHQFPATSLTLRYFCTSIAQRVSYKTIKVYLAGIHLEHPERGLHDPTDDKLLQLLCTAQEKRITSACYRGLPRINFWAVETRSIAVLISMRWLCCLRLAIRSDSSWPK